VRAPHYRVRLKDGTGVILPYRGRSGTVTRWVTQGLPNGRRAAYVYVQTDPGPGPNDGDASMFLPDCLEPLDEVTALWLTDLRLGGEGGGVL
jgi:hypothetical protein